MPYQPPHHPDPRVVVIVQVPADPSAVDVTPPQPVWARVDVEGRGEQRAFGFAFKASPTTVYVQLQCLGRTHHVWVARDRVARDRVTRRRITR